MFNYFFLRTKQQNQHKGNIFRAEISLHLSGKVLKAGQKAEHMREAIDLCIPKITQQINKYKTVKRKNLQPGSQTIRME